MSIEASQKLGTEILQLLDLPVENCRSFELAFKAQEPMTIRAEYYAGYDEKLNDIKKVIKKYHLTEIV